MSDTATAEVVQIPEPFEAEVSVPQGDGSVRTVQRKFRAKVVRARSPEEALETVRVDRQQDGFAPTTLDDIEQHSWKNLHQDLITPPYNQLKLLQLEEVSNVLRECLDAMATNIDGFGFTFRLRPMSDEFAEANRAEIDREFRKLTTIFQTICLDISLTECRRRTRRATEGVGNGYWELVRDSEGVPQQIVHLAPQRILIAKTDSQFTPFKMKLVDPETFEIIEVERKKRFRRYAQVTANGRVSVWLKEFGDPRQINRKTGKVHNPSELDQDGNPKGDLSGDLRAQECIHFKVHSDRTPYGIPRWIGRLVSILSNRKAEEVNFFSIDSHIPSMFIMVEGGQLSDVSIQRLTEMVEASVSMNPNRTAFVILEAESGDLPAFIPGAPGSAKISVKELSNSQISEELYSILDENGQKKVIRSFRLPLLLVGRDEGLTKANGVVSRQLANEQVFAPERQPVDWLFNRLLPEMGIRFHLFKSKAPNVTDNAELIRLMLAGEKSGAVSPRRADLIMTDVMEMPLGPLPSGVDPDTPFSIQFAQAQNAMLPPKGEGEKEQTARSESWLDSYMSDFLFGDSDDEDGES